MATLQVSGADKIKVIHQGKSLGVFGWTGKVLRRIDGKEIELSSDEKRQKIVAAIVAYRVPKVTTKYGYEIADDERHLPWKFISVENDAHGVYQLTISGTGPIEVEL